MQTQVKLQSALGPRGGQGRKTAFFFGAGYTALRLAPHLRAMGYSIAATVRDGRKNRWLRAQGITPIAFKGQADAELKAVLSRAQIILSSAPPLRGGTDPILSSLDTPLRALAPRAVWAGYLSATSVYGDRQGGWAFEDELLRPSTERGRARIEAELTWLETGLPLHVFRLAGIYGPKLGRGNSAVTRSPLERLRSGKARAVIKPGHVVNRIHVDDIVSALLASIAAPNPARVYNIADGHPAPPQEVIAFGARLLNIPAPPTAKLDDPSVSDMARSFYMETKRIDISRARAELGFAPRYGDYRQGLLALADEDTKPRSAATVYLAGHIDVPAEALEAVKAALPQHIKLSRAEAGCLRFDAVQDKENPHRFHIFESFTSQAAFAAHQARTAQSEWGEVSKACLRDYALHGADML